MGAKQSKRSVDISGKEADGAGEVAAAGAGGEGRVEQLADPDALKAQINGDAHIHEQSDKEKELDSGTPENEKDATQEKEGKETEVEKESTPITNGEGDQKTENGESATTEEGKKPKKEKVKKKWSLRSISFSRKDKPKQEKKQKEEEPKANGEPEKVPEETVDTTPESPESEVAEEVKPLTEAKEEKAPETPVTEPITNGSSTPESPKVETPVVEESVVTTSPEIDRPESKGEIEPEQLPVNGLSLVEPIQETSEVESKIEETVENQTETTEVVPVPEIPVIKEVCVTQLPLIEPSPPPLPANPPPSCVASFAATTMAPELTAASLSNTETVITTPLPSQDDKVTQNDPCPDSQTNLINNQTVINDPIPIIKESVDEKLILPDNQTIDPILENLPEKLNNDIEDMQPVISEISLPTEEPIINNTGIDAVITSSEETTIEAVETEEKENAVKVLEENVELAKTDEIIAIKVTVNDVLEVVNTDLKEDTIKAKVNEVIPDTDNTNENAQLKDNIIMASSDDIDETVKSNNINNSAQDVNTIDDEEKLTVKYADTVSDDDSNIKSNIIEIEAPFSTDAEKIIEPVATIFNDIDDLPPPPPAVDDVDIDENEMTTLSVIPEMIHQTNEINHRPDTDKTETTDTIDQNDKEAQQEIAETPKESGVDAIDSVQNNELHGEIGTDDNIAEPKPIDNLDTLKVECEKAASAAEESMPPPISEEQETTPAAGAGTDVDSESIPPPAAEACQTEEPSPPGSLDALPDTPQDPICEKMVDLIPDHPAIPELKTEMLQETSNDVVVAN